MPDETALTVKTANLDLNIAGAVCYVPLFGISIIAPIAFLVLEPKEHTAIRFHSIQSLLFQVLGYGGLVVAYILVTILMVVGSLLGDTIGSIVGLVGMLISLVLTLGFIGVFLGEVALAVLTFMKKQVRIPLLGSYAARFAGHDLG